MFLRKILFSAEPDEKIQVATNTTGQEQLRGEEALRKRQGMTAGMCFEKLRSAKGAAVLRCAVDQAASWARPCRYCFNSFR